MKRYFKATVTLMVEESELAQGAEHYTRLNKKPCPDHKVALATDLQACAYDTGAMHGHFLVESVEPATGEEVLRFFGGL